MCLPEDAAAWIAQAFDGRPFRVVDSRVRSWSSVHTIESDGATFFFKTEGPGAPHEPRLIVDLAERWPGLAVDVVAADLEREWLLMPDHGGPIRDGFDIEGQVAVFERLTPAYAAMQRDSRDLVDPWIAAGTPDRRVGRLPELVDHLLSDARPERAIPLDDAGRSAIEATLRRLEQRVADLAAAPFAIGLDHSDLHGGNVLCRDGDARISDWGDACITHPFASLFVIYQHAVAKLPSAERRDATFRLRDAYLDVWRTDASERELREAFAIATWLGHIVRALSFMHHYDGSDPSCLPSIAEFLRRWEQQESLLTDPDELVAVIANQTEG